MTSSENPRTAGGLGRFVRSAAGQPNQPNPPLPAGFERFLEKPKPPEGEHCEMCHEAIAEEHPHVVNLESRALMCACRPCYMLFTERGAGGRQVRLRARPLPLRRRLHHQ